MMKRYKAVYSSSALADIKEARKWYDRQQKGLGKKLTEDIKNTVISIKRNPYFTSIKYDNVHAASCKIFPYSLHYEINDENLLVRIVAVFHFSRFPFWMQNQ